MRFNLLFLIFIGSLSIPAQARPAPYYWWTSSVSDARICAQTSPGKAWVREDRPFRDSHCNIRLEAWQR
jgi:hypothetical protein